MTGKPLYFVINKTLKCLLNSLKPQLLDRFDINQFLQIFDAFFPYYRNETECNNEIVIKVNFSWAGAEKNEYLALECGQTITYIFSNLRVSTF